MTTRATRIALSRTILSTTGRPPSPIARRWESARPSSCSRGRKKPGARANVANQSDEIGLNSSAPPTAHVPTLKKAYVATPAMSRAAATGTVPSGSGARVDAGEDTKVRGYPARCLDRRARAPGRATAGWGASRRWASRERSGGGADLVHTGLEGVEQLLLQLLDPLDRCHGEADADVGGVAGAADDLLGGGQVDVGEVELGQVDLGQARTSAARTSARWSWGRWARRCSPERGGNRTTSTYRSLLTIASTTRRCRRVVSGERPEAAHRSQRPTTTDEKMTDP